MKRTPLNARRIIASAFPTLLVLGFLSSFETRSWAAEPEQAEAIAAHVRQLTGISRGICTILGGDDGHQIGRLAVELGWDQRLLVHVWTNRDAVARQARRIAVDRQLHGRSILVEQGSPKRLPYADNTVDVVILLVGKDGIKDLDGFSLEEILRALRPEGKVLVGGTRSSAELVTWIDRVRNRGGRGQGARIGEIVIQQRENHFWASATKPRSEAEGQWSHIEHGPDNNPVADDALIKAPYMTKWLDKPYYIAMPAVTVAAKGRIFLATGHIAHHQREEPWLGQLIARNGYNGTILWQRKLPDHYLVHRSTLIATSDSLLMIDPDGGGCLVLDAETGQHRKRIDLPARRGPWKWMALQDGVLLALVGGDKDPSETTIVRSERPHWSWGELSKGYYPKRIPWGFGEKIVAFDLESGQLLWEHEADSVTESHGAIDSRGLAVGGQRLFYYAPDSHIGCLDLKTGESVWMNPAEEIRKLVEQAGHGLGSTPGFRTMSFCLYTPEVLVYQGQTRQNVVAISTSNGYLLWHREKTTNNPNVLSLDNQLVLGIGEGGGTLLVDPRNGTTLGDLGFAKRSCARLTATSDSLFCRGMPEGLTRFDRNTKKVTFNGAMRPSCNDGVVAANGLLYMGPWACDCNLTLMGRIAMCSAGSFDFKRKPDDPETSPPYGDLMKPIAQLVIDATDWETYRGNNWRSASTSVAVPHETTTLWTYRPKTTFRPTAPTTAGGLIFVGGDDGAIRAVDAETGDPRWQTHTAGPIFQPPTIAEGRVYFGSGDGYVYCHERATGRPLWRFRAAPIERRIPCYGSLSSTWPVHSGVLVQDGVAYAAAGIIDYDGTYVYALDARTGEILWENDSSGHLDPALRKGVSAQGTLTIAAGRLWIPGGNVISPASYDLKTGQYRGPLPGDGSPKTNRGEEIGVFKGQHIILGGRLRYSADGNVVSPGFFSAHPITETGVRGGASFQSGRIAPAWDDSGIAVVKGRRAAPIWLDADQIDQAFLQGGIREIGSEVKAHGPGGADTVSLAMTPGTVVCVSRKQITDNQQTEWACSAFSRKDGAILWERRLSGAAMSGGLAIDREGRILVVLEDGRIECIGGAAPFQTRLARMLDKAGQSESARKAAISRLLSILEGAHTDTFQEPVIEALMQLGHDFDQEAAQRGSLIRWHLLGPVPWNNDSHPTDARLIGEPDVDLKATLEVDGQKLRWQSARTIDTNGKVDLASRFGPQGNRAVYAHARFTLPEDLDLVLRVGSNDGFKCWLNGTEVGRFDGGRGYAPDQDALAAKGKEGENLVLLKITQHGSAWSFGVRVTVTDGHAVSFEQ